MKTQLTIHGTPLLSTAWLPASRRRYTEKGDGSTMAKVEDEMLEGGFWKADELEAEQTGTIADEFMPADTDYGRKMRGQLTINGKDKTISLNNTSTKALSKGLGKDSKKWTGKKVKVEVIVQMVSGEKKGVIYLSPK